MLTQRSLRWFARVVSVALAIPALFACASRQTRDTFLVGKGILIERRYRAPEDRVDGEAARALVDLGYTIASRDSGEIGRSIQAAPRSTWDECVSPDIRALSQHPVVVVFVVTKAGRDSTVFEVGAHTLRRVPNVIVRGESANADAIVKVCAVISVVARLDTLLGELRPRPNEVAGRDSAPTAPATRSSSYDNLLDRLRKGDTLVDYTALRMAYTRTAQYRPYPVEWNANTAMLEALERRRFEEVRRIADSILSTNYVDPDAHLGAMAAAYSLGDSARGTFHAAVYRGLIASIASRSGRTLDSAIIVLSVPEEYALLRARGLKRNTQALMQCGQSYCDRLEVVSQKTGETSVLYFDVSIPHAWAVRNLPRR